MQEDSWVDFEKLELGITHLTIYLSFLTCQQTSHLLNLRDQGRLQKTATVLKYLSAIKCKFI